MYFITAQDPNYTVKGSRDPLGFQVIWQEAGRRLIPYLSTVSTTLKDYQILCIAYALKEKLQISDSEFEPFFLRIEQLMAYTRFLLNRKEGFNGIEKINKIIATTPNSIKISNLATEQILSSQKAYGIWGKYIRPFTDMKIKQAPEFGNIYFPKIESNNEFLKQAALLKKKSGSEVAYVPMDKLSSFYTLLDKPATIEKELFTERLLQDNCNNELRRIISKNDEFLKFPFYSLIDRLTDLSDNSSFKLILKYIKDTERVISPLNHIFRYIQTQSYWKFIEIESDKYISKWRTKIETTGFEEPTKSLAILLQASNLDLVKGLILRNEEVSNRRNSAPWMRLTDKGIEVNHFEGGFLFEDYDPHKDNDNNYFLSTFISLHNQLN